jgi:hypothetical protein
MFTGERILRAISIEAAVDASGEPVLDLVLDQRRDPPGLRPPARTHDFEALADAARGGRPTAWWMNLPRACLLAFGETLPGTASRPRHSHSW